MRESHLPNFLSPLNTHTKKKNRINPLKKYIAVINRQGQPNTRGRLPSDTRGRVHSIPWVDNSQHQGRVLPIQ